MSYSTEEIQEAIERLIAGSIRRPLDTLGVRRPDVTFSDVQEAAAGAFILYPLAPFYVVLLGSKRMMEEVQAEAAVIAQLMLMVGVTGKRVLPVENIETLFNAASALQQLEGAVAKTAPKDITKLPSFQRFALNVQDFLLAEGSKVKSNGAIVPTPQEARLAIPALVRDLTERHAALIELVTALSTSITDYNSVNLPSLVARGVVSKARSVLAAHADALDALKPDDRLSKIRAIVLDLLAAKSVVQKFGSTGALTIFVPLEGTGVPYSDSTHLALPASITADIEAPHALYSGVDQLKAKIDGALTNDTISLDWSLMATVSGIRVEFTETAGTGFIIGDGTNPAIASGPPNNNQLKFKFTNLVGLNTTVTVSLTLSTLSAGNAVPRTAQQICDNINTALTSASLNTRWLAEPYFLPLHFSGTVNIQNSSGALADFVIPTNASGNMSFVEVGDLVSVAAGPNAGLWTVTVLNSSTSIRASKASGSATNETSRDVEMGPAKRAVRLKAIAPSTQINNEEQVDYVPDADKNKNGAATLGINIFSSAFCRPTMSQRVADDINVKLPSKLLATAVVDGAEFSFRTEPGLSTSLVSTKLRTTGDVDYTAGSPNAIDLVIPGGGLVSAGVLVGDVVVLRGGTPGGTSWTITALSDTTCHATSTETAVDASGISVEFGTPPPISRWDAIEIPSGILSGRYYVRTQGTSKLDIILFSGLPTVQDPTTRLALTTSGTYGVERLVISSRNETTASKIDIDDTSTAIAEFFSTPVADAYGSTPWFQLPAASTAVDTGDQLETHATQYNEPSNTYAITSVSKAILGISPNMPSNETWSFDDQPVPFARIRNGMNLNFADYKELLDAWLLRSINLTTYFRDLNRYLNPLLQNATPTAVQVQTALDHLEMLLDYLIDHEETMIPFEDTLEGAVAIYKVDPVGAVDTLIRSFIEKGADRAVDILLEGRFASFFGMDINDVSYASAMQKGMREMVQNDVPIRSTRRREANQSRLRSSVASPDFEFTLTDSENMGVPDVPTDVDPTPR